MNFSCGIQLRASLLIHPANLHSGIVMPDEKAYTNHKDGLSKVKQTIHLFLP